MSNKVDYINIVHTYLNLNNENENYFEVIGREVIECVQNMV